MKRYEPAQRGFVVLRMEEDPEGTYVKYSDVEGLIEALKYYANPNNWRSDGGLDFHPHVRTKISRNDEWLPEDEVINCEHVERVGGKNARDALYISGVMNLEALKKAGVE